MYTLPVIDQLKLLQNYIHEAELALQGRPDGIIIVHQGRKKPQYYYKQDASEPHGHYIREKESSFIRELIQKDYEQKFLKQAYKIETELEKLIAAHSERSASFLFQPLAGIYTHLHSARKPWVKPYVLPDEQFIEEWLSAPYQGLGFGESQPLIQTESGLRVRSKSEMILADKYTLLGIPFLYEKPVQLIGMGIVHADFQLLEIRERTTIIHEHLGMMSDPDYCHKALRKIDAYERSG